MKILFLNDFIPPRNNFGPGKRDFELAREFKKRGHDVYFITSCQDRKFEGEENIDGIKIFNIYSKYDYRFKYYIGVYNFFSLRKIKKILKKVKPEVVHADIVQFHLSYASLKVAKKYSKALFFTSRDAGLFNYGKLFPKKKECANPDYKVKWIDGLKIAKKRFNPLRGAMIKHYLKYVDKIFAVSGELKNALSQNGIENVEVVHNGLAIPADAAVGRETGANAIFIYGRMNESKGVFMLLDCFSEILMKVPNVKIIFAGVSEEEKKKISDYMEKTGIDDNKVEIHKWVDSNKIKEIYKSVSVVVSPSLCFDWFPGVNLEAALRGKPVVTTCFGGAKEFIIDGKTGFVVSPYNKKELAEKIIDLLKDKAKAEKFGRDNFERLRDNFSIEKQAEILLGWYKKYAN